MHRDGEGGLIGGQHLFSRGEGGEGRGGKGVVKGPD